MPIYDLRCADGHRFEVIQSFTAALPVCPACGSPTARVPARVGLTGTAALPPSHDRLPQTWRGTYNGNREYLNQLRSTAEARTRLEDRHPELAADRRPVLAHEGRYENVPLRSGDPAPAGPAHTHTHTHPQPAKENHG